jgi:hemolysin activation/secretion protein
LFARIDGQIASKNLDISEKMELGGMYAVRAYPEGEAYGDEGVVASVEARLQLPKWSASAMGDTQVFGFVDAGRIKLDSKPWAAGVNRRTLSGAGLGLSWSVPGDFLMRLIYAHRLGSELATSAPDSANRFWLQFVKYF